MSEAAVLTPDLPDDVGTLKTMIGEKLILLRNQEVRITALAEQLALLRHKHFASSSEKVPVDQSKLFNEAEVASQACAAENEITVAEHTRKRGGRKPLPDHLPRVRVEHDIAAAEKLCGCGCWKSRIGEETSEQLDIIPAQARVLQHVRFVYACRNCEGTEGSGPAETTAPLPPQPIPKSNASPGTLAHIVTAKFQDGLPLHRQEKIFARLGVELPRELDDPGWRARGSADRSDERDAAWL
jgi:transposase